MTSHSAVQQALLLPEILQMFCNGLLDGSEDSQTDLLSVALTSHAFCEPALDGLWRTISSFDPIIACLPDDLWIREESKVTVLSLARSLVPGDVQRYKSHYAHRIRTVRLNGYNISTIFSLNAFQALQLEIGPEHGAFSPRLISLDWIGFYTLQKCGGEIFDQIYPMFTAFVGKDVETLSFRLAPNEPIQTTAIWSVARRLPNLKKLSISPSDSSYQSDKHINCSWWSRLADLRISITDGAIMRLASLPHLTRLKVFYKHTLPLNTPGGTFNRFSSEPNFPSIQTLEVDSDTLPSITAFLQYLPPTNGIRSLECRASAIASYPESKSLLATVGSHCNPDTLEQLFLMDNSRQVEDQAQDNRIDVSGLLKFENLTSLIINFSGGLWLTSEETRRMTKTWPTLKTLRIDVANRRVPQIDHKDLLHIIYSCPSLQHLTLPFDATRVEGAERHLSPGNDRVSALIELEPAYSPISSTSRVIQLFTVHCPNLRTVQSQFYGPGEEYEAQWDVVNDHF